MSSVQTATAITLDRLCTFSRCSDSFVTVDAPLFGSVLIFKGNVISRGTIVEPEKIGRTIGYPPPDQIVIEASRFWIQHQNGIRERKTRPEMAKILADQ